jgi:nucleotide-binding universal stress UspA family protein
MADPDRISYIAAIRDFRRARRQAVMNEIIARLTGKPADLYSYEEVRQKLKVVESSNQQLKDIPLDAIVGSVGRYSDFTRDFLPRRDSAQERWSRVMAAMSSLTGVPPIEAYQIGDVFFVKDGNHRVSVARQMGSTHIEGYVTEIRTKVPFSTDTEPDDLILGAEHLDFLETTQLDKLRPEAHLQMTVPGQYRSLLEHIEVHRYFMGIDQDREIPYHEAVTHWYDTYYLPVVDVIRERGVLRDFPERTETDLYLWTLEHRSDIAKDLGWEVGPGPAAADLAAEYSPRPERVISRLGRRILDAVLPDALDGGPAPGQWRKERVTQRPDDCLLADILVAISGEERGWNALDGALAIARCEDARMHGLHVIPSAENGETEGLLALQSEFENRCQAAGFRGKLLVEAGKIPRVIVERARLADLVVLSLSNPYAPQATARLSSGLRTILNRCPTPVLMLPGPVAQMERILVAYDDSPKAREALFMATYLGGQWGVPPIVITVVENGRDNAEALDYAQEYTQSHGVEGVFLAVAGPVAPTILASAEEHDVDLIIVGGYGSSPLLEIALGSTVGDVLRNTRRPVLVCR